MWHTVKRQSTNWPGITMPRDMKTESKTSNSHLYFLQICDKYSRIVQKWIRFVFLFLFVLIMPGENTSCTLLTFLVWSVHAVQVFQWSTTLVWHLIYQLRRKNMKNQVMLHVTLVRNWTSIAGSSRGMFFSHRWSDFLYPKFWPLVPLKSTTNFGPAKMVRPDTWSLKKIAPTLLISDPTRLTPDLTYLGYDPEYLLKFIIHEKISTYALNLRQWSLGRWEPRPLKETLKKPSIRDHWPLPSFWKLSVC